MQGSLGFDPEATEVAAGNEHGRRPRAARRARRAAPSNPSRCLVFQFLQEKSKPVALYWIGIKKVACR
jgi:hypothetical protein